jgi:hypothetical protein
LLEAEGNIWGFSGDAYVITTNGFVKKDGKAVMGRGIAKQAAERHTWLPKLLGESLKARGNHVDVFQSIVGSNEMSPMVLITFPVKTVWWEKADPALIERSAHELVDAVAATRWKRIIMPRPGCGNGQLDWNHVKPIIEPILDDRFLVVEYGVQ